MDREICYKENMAKPSRWSAQQRCQTLKGLIRLLGGCGLQNNAEIRLKKDPLLVDHEIAMYAKTPTISTIKSSISVKPVSLHELNESAGGTLQRS
jgi:hypothetical protein